MTARATTDMTEDKAEKKLTRAERIAQRALEKQKKMRRRIIIGGVVGVLLALLIWRGLQPYEATVHYGLCRVFLEQQIRYPQTVRITSIESFDQSMRMYYTYTDEVGGVRSEMFECEFRPYNQLNLHAAYRNRRPIDPEIVEQFNKTIPLIASMEMDLVIPRRPPPGLSALKMDY